MSDKIKLVHFTYSWISSGVSGFLSNITRELKDDFDQTIVVWDDRGSVFDDEIRAAGIGIHSLCRGTAHGIVDLPIAAAAFRSYLKKEKPDIVHVHCSTSPELRFLEVAKQLRVPVRVAHCHNAGFEGSKLMKYLKKEVHVSRKEDYADVPTLRLACSDDAGKWLYNDGESYIVIQNPVDVDKYRFSQEKRDSLRTSLGISEHQYAFCCTGRLSEQKNQRLLITAFARYRQRHPDSVLLLAGDGDQRGTLSRIATELGVDHCVLFLGTVSDVGAVLSASDGYVLPSLYEGFGTSVLEAETNGLPCLLSEAVDRNADVQGNAVWLAPDASPILWSNGLDLLCTHTRYDGLPAILASGYTKEKVASYLARLYHSALDEIDK